MLVIKVELHPYGDANNVQILASMIIANDGSSNNANYGNYTVYKVDKFGNRRVSGSIKNHRRLAESVWKLVNKAIKIGRF